MRYWEREREREREREGGREGERGGGMREAEGKRGMDGWMEEKDSSSMPLIPKHTYTLYNKLANGETGFSHVL